MYQKGSVSVFLALVCLCVISIIMISLESARTSGARWQARNVANIGIDNLFSEYNVGLWKDYKIALLEYLGDEELEESLSMYAADNMEKVSNYRLSEASFDITEKKMIVDEGGRYLEKEIVDFMRYAPLDIASIFKNLENILKDAKAANSGENIADDFRNISKLAMDLEKQATVLADILEEISIAYAQASEYISNENISSFNEEASKILHKIQDLEKQFKKYEKQAGITKKRIEEAGKKEEWRELKEDNKNSIKNYASSYDLYNEEQRKRLEDLKTLVAGYKNEVDNIKDAISKAEEIESLKEKSDKENDYSSEIDSLYEDLISIWNSLDIRKNIQKTQIDDEKKSILYDLKDSIDKSLLSLVLPKDKEVSNLNIENKSLPSSGVYEKEKAVKDLDIASKVLIQEYIDRFFNDYTDNKVNTLAYEKEYLIEGTNVDEENLAGSLKKLLFLRSGLNYISISKDKQKMFEVKTLATAIMGACALPELAFLLEFFILSLWSLAEGVADIKCLLAGGEVPILKNGADFKISINSLLDFNKALENVSTDKKANKKSMFTYNNYLKILMLMEEREKLNYRILDILEMNMKNMGNNIKMKDMLYALKADMNIKSSRLFSNFVYEGISDIDGNFYMNLKVQKAY